MAVTRLRIASYRGRLSALAARSWSCRISSGIRAANSSPHRDHGSASWSSNSTERAVLASRRPASVGGSTCTTTRS